MEMNSKDALKRTVDDLQKQAEEIEELGVKLLEEAPFMDAYPDGGFFKTLDYRSPLKKLQRETILKYQQWYSVALNLVDEYAPEWLEEFKLRYSSNKLQTSFYVMDCLRLDVYIRSNRDHIVAGFAIDFETQLSILLSIPSIMEIKEKDLRKLISADVARFEIEQAEILLVSGFERAAGSIAGVALELHLKTLCDVNGVSYSPKPTIETLVQALYKGKKLDVTDLKNIQYLGSIRNKCSHPEPVSAKEVQSLIGGVKKLI